MNQQKIFSILPVTCHTRHVGPGSTFVAIKGMREDGACYILHALDLGATTIVIEQSVILDSDVEQAIMQRAQLLRVDNTRYALAQLSAEAHGYPAQQLKIIAIIGTKGKTTTAFLVAHILKTVGYATALLSTVKNQILDVDYPTELTTQQPDYLHAFFRQCVEEGVTHVVMEVAAQALSLHRVATIVFDAVLFLNFSQEHAEFYTTLDDYFSAKAAIVDHLQPAGFLIIPENDEQIGSLAGKLLPQQSVYFFSTATGSLRSSFEGVQFFYQSSLYEFPALIGDCNVYNARAAMTYAQISNIPLKTVREALLTFAGIPGRLNKYILPNGAIAFIDYAHNPASFEQVFSTMRRLTKNLLVVFGAGGDRDSAKRPMMGAFAGMYADHIFLTTDNPRSEDPTKIVQDIVEGIATEQREKVTIEMDRKQAIVRAYRASRAGSIILLLGKGPDEYQLAQGVKTYFSEQKILQDLPSAMHFIENGIFTKNSDVLE